MENIRIGIFGAGRGYNLSKNFSLLGCKMVAICDYHEARLEAAKEKLGGKVASYTDFDEF